MRWNIHRIEDIHCCYELGHTAYCKAAKFLYGFRYGKNREWMAKAERFPSDQAVEQGMSLNSSDEVIDSMSFGHGENMGGSSNKGHISNKTMYIALNYQERMECMNAETTNEIAQRLLELETEQDRIRYYVSLLEKREARVIRSFYIEGRSWEEIAQEIAVALRTVHKIKNRAISHLAELYAYKANLKRGAQ